MQKKELCEILKCSLVTLNKRLNSSKQIEKDMFGVLLNFDKDELIARIYGSYKSPIVELKLNLQKSTNIEDNINNLFENLELINKFLTSSK